MATVFHLEPFREFLRRAVELNRLHAPDEPLHAIILAQDALKESGQVLGDPDPATREGRAQECRRALVAIHREFPGGAPLWEQAAFLVRGFAALQPFPEASLRTGWDYAGELLAHHGHHLMSAPADAAELEGALTDRLDAAPALRRQDLLRRDANLLWLADWFRSRIAVAPRTRQA